MAAILKSKMVAIHYFNKVLIGVFERIGIANGGIATKMNFMWHSQLMLLSKLGKKWRPFWNPRWPPK